MKKYIIVLFLIFRAWTAFSQEDNRENHGENYSGITGISYNNIFERDCAYLGAIGMNFGGYSFPSRKRNVGLFTLTSLNFIVAGKNGNDIFLYDQTLAAAFRYRINDKIELLWVIGPHLSIFDVTYKESFEENAKISSHRINLGIVGDISFKYNISDVLFINFGLSAAYDFFTSGGTAKKIQGYDKEVTVDYYIVGIKPRIMIGTNERVFAGLRGSKNKTINSEGHINSEGLVKKNKKAL